MNIVKPSYVVSSIKQSPVSKGRLLVRDKRKSLEETTRIFISNLHVKRKINNSEEKRINFPKNRYSQTCIKRSHLVNITSVDEYSQTILCGLLY
jgi:hypothetical protein